MLGELDTVNNGIYNCSESDMKEVVFLCWT